MKEQESGASIGNDMHGANEVRVLLFRFLRKWFLIVISGLFGLAIGFFANRYSNYIYNVESTVIVDDDTNNGAGDVLELGSLIGSPIQLDNEISILKSYKLSLETVSTLDLGLSFFKEGRFISKNTYPMRPVDVRINYAATERNSVLFEIQIVDKSVFLIRPRENRQSFFGSVFALDSGFRKATFGEEIELHGLVFSLELRDGTPGDSYLVDIRSQESVANSLRKNIKVERDSKAGSVLRISMEHENVDFAIDYLDQLVSSYLDRELKLKNLTSENTIEFIQSQLVSISDTLAVFENRLENFRSTNRTFDLSQEGSLIYARLLGLDEQKQVLKQEILYYQKLLEYLGGEPSDAYWFPSLGISSDVVLSGMVQKLSDAQVELSRMRDSFSPDNPSLIQVKRQVEAAKRAIEENVANNIERRNIQIGVLDKRLQRLEEEVSKLPETERKLLGLRRQFTINENIYLFLLEKSAEAEIAKASNSASNLVLDTAMVSGGPVYPRKSRNLLFGLAFGLFIPIAAISLLFYFGSTIEDPKDLQAALSVDLIGNVGRGAANESLPVINSQKSSLTESFRTLRSDLSYLAPQRDRYCILVTSSMAGEGKTFVASNLACVLAMAGKRTLLVGIDLRKPKLSGVFDLKSPEGISTCLSSKVGWREVTVPSGYKHLDILPSGPIPPNPAELLLQKKLALILAEVKAEYDVVVLDCPPMGLVSETRELLQYADINFFVFRQGYSNKEQITYLNDMATRLKTSKIYALLNDVHRQVGGYGYGYGYGYGHGYYGEKESRFARWKRVFRFF